MDVNFFGGNACLIFICNSLSTGASVRYSRQHFAVDNLTILSDCPQQSIFCAKRWPLVWTMICRNAASGQRNAPVWCGMPSPGREMLPPDVECRLLAGKCSRLVWNAASGQRNASAWCGMPPPGREMLQPGVECRLRAEKCYRLMWNDASGQRNAFRLVWNAAWCQK